MYVCVFQDMDAHTDMSISQSLKPRRFAVAQEHSFCLVCLISGQIHSIRLKSRLVVYRTREEIYRSQWQWGGGALRMRKKPK